MKVLTGAQMADLDRQAIEGLGIPSLVLMESAGRVVVEELGARFSDIARKKIVIVIGKGNNGGDGLVVARRLLDLGASVHVHALCSPKEFSAETRQQADILNKLGFPIQHCTKSKEMSALAQALGNTDIVIDAIFGTGFRGAARELAAEAIELINLSSAFVCAIDIPSGVEADTGHVLGPAVCADLTVTFELPKLGLLLYPGRQYVGELVVRPIGYPRKLIDQYASTMTLVGADWVRERLPPREPYSHKGDYGKVLVVAGSRGYTGAAALAAEAALRAGAGLVYLAVPESLLPAMEAKLTEVIKLGLPDIDGALASAALPKILEMLEDKDVLVVGPGLGRHPQTVKTVQRLVAQASKPLVLDADGLNALGAEAEKLLVQRTAPTVLTPHPGELSRLIAKSVIEIESDRVGVARETAKQLHSVLVLKGVPTVTATPDGEVFLNSTGNSGLASGGSGDVLTGCLGGLLAQGLDSLTASVCAVYAHGRAADLMKPELGERGMIASDVLRALPAALREFE
ncbi:MAG: NAD(P)H-hydrate dehydratase [Candidatus Bipolaricaulota bacterium]|nr:NAD(P)H-hydrate dehydratase [Candidatus Bipolaricaulota bacterium]MCS7274376.1 NAD(P)H-hydrate dehydratase [Candidatus Bipolaricaulota bacterium]MDW8111559.1 NAD(P)H-hydrate dehydratase [Candidatus Bipolaricaulota bacterium]MDW8329796.1 NAD(P)H-hydrate dehydratase [Candidatus Bipolaricaulota bacterium]